MPNAEKLNHPRHQAEVQVSPEDETSYEIIRANLEHFRQDQKKAEFWLETAIIMLEECETRAAKIASPFSISNLTAGFPADLKDEIIWAAIEINLRRSESQ